MVDRIGLREKQENIVVPVHDLLKFVYHWIGLRENLQENIVFPIKKKGVPVHVVISFPWFILDTSGSFKRYNTCLIMVDLLKIHQQYPLLFIVNDWSLIIKMFTVHDASNMIQIMIYRLSM